MAKRYFPKGFVIAGPNGQAYRLLQDTFAGDMVVAEQFEALGGAPKPEAGTKMPHWLVTFIKTHSP